MNDDQMLTAVRSSLTSVKETLTDVHMDRPASAITGRARARRLRHAASGTAAGGLALGAGLAVALAGGPAAGGPVHVNLDAWSVNTTSTGLVELTVRELRDQALLEKTLADAGVPAIVNFNEFCVPVNQADNVTGTTGTQFIVRPVASHGALAAITVNPAAIPAGTEVDLGINGQLGNGHGILQQITIKDGAALRCGPLGIPRPKQPAAATSAG